MTTPDLDSYPTKPTVCHGEALLKTIDEHEEMSVTLFRGYLGGRLREEDALRRLALPEKEQYPGRYPLVFAVIHGTKAGPNINHDAKVILFQESDDLSHLWVRSEGPMRDDGSRHVYEFALEDALSALSRFESSVRIAIDKLPE